MSFRPKFIHFFSIFLIVSDCFIEQTICCPLPLSAGVWYSSSRGTWTISSDGITVEDFRADLTAQSLVNNLTCDSAGSTSTQYILTTNFEIFFGVFIDVYTCLDIQSTSNQHKFIYYIVTRCVTHNRWNLCIIDGQTRKTFAFCGSAATVAHLNLVVQQTTDTATGETFTSDKASACSNSDYLIARNKHILISKASFENATIGPQSVIDCPDVILGNYSVTFTKTDGSKLNDTLLDSCNDTTTLKFSNNDATVTHAFSTQNEVYCVYSEQVGSEFYVHTFNNETTDERNEIYNYACWVFAYSSGGVTGTAFPESCQQEQSSTEVQYGGQKFVFYPYVTCPLAQPEEPGFPAWAIVLLVFGGLFVLLVITILVVFLVYSRKRWPQDDEKGIAKGTSPDRIRREKDKTQRFEDDDDSGFEDRWKPPLKQMEREDTMDLVEVNRDEKLKEGPKKEFERKLEPKDAKEPLPGTSGGQKDQKESKEIEKKKQEKQKEAEKLKQKEKEKSETPEPVPPPGKKTIQPTTPRPAADDTTLARVKKDDKSDKKGQTVRVGETIKEEPEESSSEYETDESERRRQNERLLEKRKRLKDAEYIPPDLADATVVGRKKRRKHREVEEKEKRLVSREKQEEMDKALRERKKAMRKLARSKFRPATDGEETTDTENEPKGKKSKYKSDTETETKKTKKAKRTRHRKHGDQTLVEAPYTEQYHVKKHIEGELDAIDYWNLNPHSSPEFADDELELNLDKKPSPILHVQPIDDPVTTSYAVPKLDIITQEERDVWDQSKGAPISGALGFVGVELGPNGEVPEGFKKDEEGNVIRIADGAMISSGDIARQIELKRRLIFSLPRLIRDIEGRPLGGYKDDMYGPTAEWDYGVSTDEGEGEDEADKKARTSERTTPANKQVGFSDDRSIPPTPLQDGEEPHKKGRHQTTSERELLKKRLFEESKVGSPDGHVPVYFAGGKEATMYIDNAQIQRPGGELKPVNFQRSKSMKTPGRVVKSDAYDDRRAHLYRDGLSKDKKILQNAEVRRSLRQSDWTNREGLPADAGLRTNRSDMKRHLGSDDEFILVPGTMRKILRPSDLMEDRLYGDMCPRYERHRLIPGREISDISMITADTRPFSGDDRRLKDVLGPLYKDKKYFDYYLDTEALPTNAAVETRDLASHGRDFLLDVAEYWAERQPLSVPTKSRPPRDTGLPLSRLPTMLTAADSGHDSMRSYTTDRPHTADDIQNMPVPPPRNRPSRENTQDSARETLPTARTGRTQLSDIASRQSETQE